MATDTAVEGRDLRAALARVSVLSRALDRARVRAAAQDVVVERLRTENVALREQLREAQAALAVALAGQADLAARLTVLEGKLARAGVGASTPSSKLPRPGKRERPYPDKPPRTKPSGGQPGHAGRTVARREPDVTVRHEPEGPCGCGAAETGREVSTSTRQVIAVEVLVSATDHVVVNRRCSCGTLRRGTFPAGVDGPVSYDNSVKALTVGLAAGGQTPPKAVVDTLAGLTGLVVSEASVLAWTEQLAASLGPFDAACLAVLDGSAAVAVDETPVRHQQAGGGTWYVHVAATKTVTRFHTGPIDGDAASKSGRAKADITAGGLVGRYAGTLVSDCYSPYFTLHQGAHQICLAHLTREARWWAQELTAVRAGAAVPDFAAVAAILAGAVHDREDNSVALDLAVRAALVVMDGDTRHTSAKPRAYLNRLLRHHDKLFTFTGHAGVPPTSNLAEQAIKPLKVKQKRSGTYRTHDGLRTSLAIAGYLATARKLGQTHGQALAAAFAGTPILP